jgi:hypothetical protein
MGAHNPRVPKTPTVATSANEEHERDNQLSTVQSTTQSTVLDEKGAREREPT